MNHFRHPVFRRFASLSAMLFILLASATARSREIHTPLARRIAKILAQPELARAFWGIQIVSLDGKKVMYSLNEDKLFTPASNAKLFTTAAAFDLLGTEYRFKTTVESTQPPDAAGRIHGSLSLVGRGDPNLSGRELPYVQHTERPKPPLWILDDLADQLVQRGVKSVDGDLIADDSFYPFNRYPDGWTIDDLLWSYGAPVSALAVNDNMMSVTIVPGERIGAPAGIVFDPPNDFYAVDDRVTTGAIGSEKHIGVRREPGSRQLEFWGSLPADAGEDMQLTIDAPAEFAAQAFRTALAKRGVTVTGNVRVLHSQDPGFAQPGNLPATDVCHGDVQAPNTSKTSVVLASHDSLPLLDDLRVINKVSQNLHAEMLLRLLSAACGQQGTLRGSLDALRDFLLKAGLKSEEFSFHDGSGLSRWDLVSPAATVRLLQYAAAQPWGFKYMETLPVGGDDGSLASRYHNAAAQGHIHAKSGSMEHVNTLSGYADQSDGKTLVFSIMINNHDVSESAALSAIDQIVEALFPPAALARRATKTQH